MRTGVTGAQPPDVVLLDMAVSSEL